MQLLYVERSENLLLEYNLTPENLFGSQCADPAEFTVHTHFSGATRIHQMLHLGDLERTFYAFCFTFLGGSSHKSLLVSTGLLNHSFCPAGEHHDLRFHTRDTFSLCPVTDITSLRKNIKNNLCSIVGISS